MPAVLLALASASATGLTRAAEAPAPSSAVVEPIEKVAPLVLAARANEVSTVRALLSAHPAPDINQRTADGTSALHWAVYHGDSDLVTRLLAAGADANARNDYGSTPMSEAAVRGDLQLLRALLAAGADVESPNADGQTALMTVARTSNVEAGELLLAHGANPNAHEQWRDQTALMWAAAQKQPAMVRLLLNHGASVEARSLINDFTRQVTAEPRMQARPAGGFTALLYAARAGCLECAQLLVKAGADPNLDDPDGVSPLLESILNLNFDVAAFLIKHGVDVDHWDTWGRSPLYAAVDVDTLPVGGRADRPSLDQTSGLRVIKMLLVAGANPNLQRIRSSAWARRRCCVPQRRETCPPSSCCWPMARMSSCRPPPVSVHCWPPRASGPRRLIPVAATRLSPRRSWWCRRCWTRARTSMKPTAAARLPCTVRPAGAGTIWSRPLQTDTQT
jgi:ankyrin repeat protein